MVRFGVLTLLVNEGCGQNTHEMHAAVPMFVSTRIKRNVICARASNKQFGLTSHGSRQIIQGVPSCKVLSSPSA
eukprot:1894071-Pleurochrysis_carterae.AAC.2